MSVCTFTVATHSHFLFTFFFFFNDTATTEIYTLSLHDALPISIRPTARSSAGNPSRRPGSRRANRFASATWKSWMGCPRTDRKSTRLNSSHLVISYAVFCLKKKKRTIKLAYSHTVSYETTRIVD